MKRMVQVRKQAGLVLELNDADILIGLFTETSGISRVEGY